MESMIIIPAIAGRFRLRRASTDPVEEHALVTLRPKGGIAVHVEQRRR
jgi:hypothetical protein